MCCIGKEAANGRILVIWNFRESVHLYRLQRTWRDSARICSGKVEVRAKQVARRGEAPNLKTSSREENNLVKFARVGDNQEKRRWRVARTRRQRSTKQLARSEDSSMGQRTSREWASTHEGWTTSRGATDQGHTHAKYFARRRVFGIIDKLARSKTQIPWRRNLARSKDITLARRIDMTGSMGVILARSIGAKERSSCGEEPREGSL